MTEQNNIQDNVPTRQKKFWKFWVVMFLLNVGFLAVIIKLFNIQILDAAYYKKLAKIQHETRKTLQAKRGTILDRNNKVITVSIDSYSIAVDPTVLKKENRKIVANAIALSTDKEPEYYLKKITSAENQFVWLERGLQPEEADSVRKIKDRGLLIFNEPKRRFPYSHAGAQLIGLIDIDNNGLSGIELALDTMLKGRNGWKMMYKDAFQKLHSSADLPFMLPENGNSVVLTLDIDLQTIVEYELKQGVLRNEAVSGTAIAIKPNTGEILAIASYPGFDPNSSSKGPISNRRIKAITDTYEPGSTFKLFTAAAAMQENLIAEEDTVDGRLGYLAVHGRAIRDVHGMGRIPFRKAVEQSSNVVFSELAAEMNDRTFYKYIRDFGFGLKTGLELPGEASGRVQKPEDFNATSKYYMGHGYGLAVSPLQLVNAYAAVANGGVLMKPYIIKEIKSNKDEQIEEFRPTPIRRVISEHISKRLGDLFKGVVTDGTGTASKIDGLDIAGKTGTSQQLENGRYSKRNYTASFCGYFPVEDPQVALLVLIDRPRKGYYGGSVAGPIFRNIVLRWSASANLEYETDEELIQDIAKDSLKVPQLMGLNFKDAESLCEEMGFDIAIPENKGIVINQNPKAGLGVEYGSLIDISCLPKNNKLIVEDSLRPDVTKMSLGRALPLLHACGYKTKVYGNGKVIKQNWIDKERKVELYCK
jgi:cell division protein FtsI (penicillin-binding protein 3)